MGDSDDDVIMGATPAPRGAVPARQPRRASAQASARAPRKGAVAKKKKGSAQTVFTWKAQRGGLPMDVRKDLRDVLNGKKEKEQQKAAKQQEQQQARAAAAQAQQQGAAADGAGAAAAPQPPKRSHHAMRTTLQSPLPPAWEQVCPHGNSASEHAVRGVRRRLPREVLDAATRRTEGRSQKIDVSLTPKFVAMNNHFANEFKRYREVKRKTQDKETGALGPLRGPSGAPRRRACRLSRPRSAPRAVTARAPHDPTYCMRLSACACAQAACARRGERIVRGLSGGPATARSARRRRRHAVAGGSLGGGPGH